MFKKIVSAYHATVNFAKKGALAIAGGVGLIAATSTNSHAVAVLDFSAVGTKITEELTPAITAAMPIAGIILAAGIGWKLYKRFTK